MTRKISPETEKAEFEIAEYALETLDEMLVVEDLCTQPNDLTLSVAEYEDLYEDLTVEAVAVEKLKESQASGGSVMENPALRAASGTP